MNGFLLLSHSVTATLLFGAVNAQIDALNASRTTLEAVGSTWRSFPTRELLTARIGDPDRALVAGTNDQRKHLLHQVVKEVCVQERTSVEIHYAVTVH